MPHVELSRSLRWLGRNLCVSMLKWNDLSGAHGRDSGGPCLAYSWQDIGGTKQPNQHEGVTEAKWLVTINVCVLPRIIGLTPEKKGPGARRVKYLHFLTQNSLVWFFNRKNKNRAVTVRMSLSAVIESNWVINLFCRNISIWAMPCGRWQKKKKKKVCFSVSGDACCDWITRWCTLCTRALKLV